jgi:hypothetical protein
MGIDACIYIKCRSGRGEPQFETPLPEDCKILPVDDLAPKGASLEVATGDRYYGPGYERGDWPRICAILLSLFATSDVEVVWYFGEVDDHPKPMKPDDVFAICRHYVQHGHRPYYEDRAGS